MLRSSPSFVLFACVLAFEAGATEPASDALARGAVAPAMAALSLAAGVPHPGGEVTLTVANARAGETVAFWASGGGVAQGQGPCVAQLGGLCLDLGANTVLAGTAVADASGAASLTGLVPLGLVQGSPVTFQAAVRRATSVKSNPVVRTVGAPAWSHTIAVDGSIADWTAAEAFESTSGPGTMGAVTWDAQHVYVAFQHPDVRNGGAQHWEIVTIGTGAPGSRAVPPLNTQQPALPFEAELQLRRKADGSYDDLMVWNDTQGAWIQSTYVLGTMGSSAAEAGEVLEIAIPRSLIGSSRLQVVLSQVYEGSGFESTYGGVPGDSFVDGYDPDFSTWLELDLSLPDPSAVQNP